MQISFDQQGSYYGKQKTGLIIRIGGFRSIRIRDKKLKKFLQKTERIFNIKKLENYVKNHCPVNKLKRVIHGSRILFSNIKSYINVEKLDYSNIQLGNNYEILIPVKE